MEQLNIEKLINGGYGLGFKDGKTYMIENAYPDEIVEIDILKNTKNIVFGKTKKVVKQSKDRVSSVCNHFPKCGGCQWINYKYDKQIEAKQNIVKEQLRRIAKIDMDIDSIEPSLLQYQYRNKMEFSVSKEEELKIGLNEKNSSKILDIENCPISPNIFDKVRNKVKGIINTLKIPVYNYQTKKGVIKHIILRKSFSQNKTMLIIVTNSENVPNENELKSELRKLPVDSIIHVMNSSDKVKLRGPYKTWKGEGVLIEEFDGFTYQIPPTSFFQTNYEITSKMLKHILDYLKPKKTDNKSLLDLYCGVGLFSVYFSPLFKDVKGVEFSKISIKAANANKNINFLKNATFYVADAIQFLNKSKNNFDYIIIDPPRAGLGKNGVELLSKKVNNSLIYISCDPSTLARDLKGLTEKGFKIKSIKSFDMFPNTFHVETIVILEK
ncbi:23S rRNA (uracil(1939)-C(5))-methyltransferase RlmD [Geotoga petraea]|uniref:23S rRNA (Uracil(1939)-C(5))-methyltransferase RlmD n=1 Tax=Geotoga petraea TaxID=28234 RepID=A0A1G6JEM8_9BACT|nr:23S rRNA (uracil(1939)-C(5))-methyltransferase RlmD [Geotoga petraea]TGG88203.1 23S rRNA (uracil(1939)-C(5))-methyltransferase RlmD [Geotoga petraea]SDC17171.1 23S rRNA (uracil1939-C5)-methyltransferase [Geotoga petraea]